MFAVEIYAAVRKFIFVEGNSRREAARVFGLSRDTIAKMCRYSAPPGYIRSKPPVRPKLGPLVPVIDAILESRQNGSAQAASYGGAGSVQLHLCRGGLVGRETRRRRRCRRIEASPRFRRCTTPAQGVIIVSASASTTPGIGESDPTKGELASQGTYVSRPREKGDATRR